MEQSLEQRIRERAYALWLEHGGAEGNAEQHWLAAEREVLAMMTAAQAPASETAIAAPNSAPKPAKRRPASTAKPRARAAAR